MSPFVAKGLLKLSFLASDHKVDQRHVNDSNGKGIVNLTADTLIPEILLDIILPKINGLADRKSRIFTNLSGIFSLTELLQTESDDV